MPSPQTLRVRYEDLVSDPLAVLKKIASWAELDEKPFARFARQLPIINPTRVADLPSLSADLEKKLERYLPLAREVAVRLGFRS